MIIVCLCMCACMRLLRHKFQCKMDPNKRVFSFSSYCFSCCLVKAFFAVWFASCMIFLLFLKNVQIDLNSLLCQILRITRCVLKRRIKYAKKKRNFEQNKTTYSLGMKSVKRREKKTISVMLKILKAHWVKPTNVKLHWTISINKVKCAVQSIVGSVSINSLLGRYLFLFLVISPSPLYFEHLCSVFDSDTRIDWQASAAFKFQLLNAVSSRI